MNRSHKEQPVRFFVFVIWFYLLLISRIKMEINPWNVESIEPFSYFKCLSQVKKYFEDHAVKNHHLSAVLFDKAIENLNHDDEMTSEECESKIFEWTSKFSN